MYRRGILEALAAAVLFGAATPLAKLLIGTVPPVLLAGLLYGGAGLGLSVLLRFGPPRVEARLGRRDLPVFAGAVLVGGVVAPVLLMLGLVRTPATSASLLLNLEGVFTTLIAWFVLKESFDRRIVLGVIAIAAGSVLLVWPGAGAVFPLGALLVAGACLAWAVDNNLTRAVAAADPLQIAAGKGLIAGAANSALAILLGVRWPSLPVIAIAGVVGFIAYGLSLALFVLALRHLGAARSSAYFGTAPFIGALASAVLLAEPLDPRFWAAFGCMAAGLALHLSERHEHPHAHERLAHTHRHSHDSHHHHAHDFPWLGDEPHAHAHLHDALRHRHVHYPDIHHRHPR